ncbi:hypothetical protein LTR70_007555 [Exophiala xenobiotica]|uniref:Clr5 domain-containing protein n=1 Tax=Lithohypha guttulata TaxID=1690604 RepID=A0ABR0K7J7_9EURO|nr:hypothetical protein LTR24_005978 [Lithohypha guttulata]KAK5313571.1 hypothetical protein LTR70_007555 [Exophiala xenobiotica]
MAARHEARREYPSCASKIHFQYPPTADDWRRIRPVLIKMYQDEKQTLVTSISDVRKLYGFRASERMFRRKFEAWGIERKFKEHEVRYMLVLEHVRRSNGKCTELLRNGKPVDAEALERYVRRKGMRVSQVLSDNRRGKVEACHYIQCLTPRAASPTLFVTERYRASEMVHQEWKTMIWGTLEAELCFAGETGLVWAYHDDQPNVEIFQAFEIFQDFRHYSRISIGKREVLLLRRGCLLLEDVIQCSSFLWWILVVQILAYLVRSGMSPFAKLIQTHIAGLAEVKLNSSHPHNWFLNHLSGIPLEDLGPLTVALLEIMIDVERQIDQGNAHFSWDSRVNLWVFKHRYGGTHVDREAFALLQEGVTHYGPHVHNKMAESLIDEAYWNDIDIGAWYRAECKKAAIPRASAAWHYDFNHHGMEFETDTLEPQDFLTLACRHYNDGELQAARQCWIYALHMPVRKELALGSATIHYVLEHLDNLSTASEVADGDLNWRLWKAEIEKIWQAELETDGIKWKKP